MTAEREYLVQEEQPFEPQFKSPQKEKIRQGNEKMRQWHWQERDLMVKTEDEEIR